MKIFRLIIRNVFLLIPFAGFINPSFAQAVNKGIIQILYSPGHPANTIIPSKNTGGALDGHFKGDIERMLTPENISEMKLAGLKPISYRLRTELAGEVWHWNPEGKWSDSSRQEGYWISDSTTAAPIVISYGYRLPRRGNTLDQANNDGYSRISDGDTTTFWKSNPYLDSFYTHESDNLHPQWIIVDLGKKYRINAIQINWGNPYAISFQVDYAKGNDPQYFDPFEPGIWHSFPSGSFNNPKGENKLSKLTASPLSVRFIRVSFAKSSYTSYRTSNDIRDKSGFAVKEMKAGILDAKGNFHDRMRHAASHDQSVVYVSSTDPWHTAKDIDYNTEQPGVDRIFEDGITSNQPALMPAAVLYDTPDNVLSLLQYLKAKKYNVKELEMGEEPEGQLVSPTDYAALYFQLGKKIKEIEHTIKLGGPCFASLSSEEEDSTTFTEAKWTTLFLNYLRSHSSLELFNFFSFEWYPFDNLCAPSAPQLAAAPGKLSIAMKNIQSILPHDTPLYVTEYGYSAYEGKPEVEIQGALMYADILGKFMEMGGRKSFLYGYEPAFLQQSFNCGYGNNMLLGLNDNGKIKYKTASFYGTQMLTHFWAQPADSELEVFPSVSTIYNRKKESLVSAYCLRSAADKWSVMLINKDPKRTWNVQISVRDISANEMIAWKPTHLIQYTKDQYQWEAEGMTGHPSKSLPPVMKKIRNASNVVLPPFSMTVIN